MEEKVYLKDSEKVKLLEQNNMLMARQMEAISTRERFTNLNTSITSLQKDLDEYVNSLLKEYNCEGGRIDNDYSVSPPMKREVK